MVFNIRKPDSSPTAHLQQIKKEFCGMSRGIGANGVGPRETLKSIIECKKTNVTILCETISEHLVHLSFSH